ncbi:MAG TPA: alpha/beta fold hydrolase [Candidatus Eremiobacteraceae bacterium]|nr:alpha/beta fold hydrolase [Candidatus Eremiobacteraceae bacterium]
MSKQYLPGGEPFEFGSGGAGVLVLHGFTGSPFEVRALGEALHREGFSVFGPALAGHATDESHLESTTADDYFAEIERAYADARKRCERLYAVGLSMGGTLALHLAAVHHLPGVVTVSTPVFLYPMVAASVPVLHQWMPGLRTPANFAAWQGNVVGYKSASIASVNEIVRVFDRVRTGLHRVRSPLLVLHSTRDLTVPVASAHEIHEKAASEVKRMELIDAGSHLMTVEPNLSLIRSQIVDFLKERERSAGRPEGRKRRSPEP